MCISVGTGVEITDKRQVQKQGHLQFFMSENGNSLCIYIKLHTLFHKGYNIFLNKNF